MSHLTHVHEEASSCCQGYCFCVKENTSFIPFFQAVKKRERKNTQKVKENNGVFFIFRVAFVLLCVIKMPALLRQQRGIRETRIQSYIFLRCVIPFAFLSTAKFSVVFSQCNLHSIISKYVSTYQIIEVIINVNENREKSGSLG